MGPRGGTNCTCAGQPRLGGVGKGLTVDLPIGCEWKRVQDHERRGNHVLGNEVHEPSSQIARGDRVQSVSWDNIGGKAHLAGCIRSARHNGFAHRLVPYQGGLDLAEFHAESADLDLVIDSPQAFERPVGPPPSEVASAVEASARRVAEGIWEEPLGRQPGSLPIAASEPCATDVQLADNPERNNAQPVIEDVELRVGDRPPDRDRRLTGLDPPCRRPDRGLGRTIEVPERGPLVDQPIGQRAGELLRRRRAS